MSLTVRYFERPTMAAMEEWREELPVESCLIGNKQVQHTRTLGSCYNTVYRS
jgi:hypothetical protein